MMSAKTTKKNLGVFLDLIMNSRRGSRAQPGSVVTQICWQMWVSL